MSSDRGRPGAPDGASDTDGLGRLFVLILLTQAVVTVALYWLGRHFS